MTDLSLSGQSNDSYVLTIKNNLYEMINDLQDIQFEIIKANIYMQSRISSSSADLAYNIQYLLQNNKTKIQSNLYNDALFQYITSASSIRNSTLSSFSSASDAESTAKNFFFIRVNGLDPLRSGSENIAQGFYQFYYDRTSYHDANFRIIMIVACILLVISQFILVPIVFSVHKTNNKVLSLFGYIPTLEIHELAQKCERYIVNHLEERTEKREFSFEKEDNNHSPADDNPDGIAYSEVHGDEPSGNENLQISMVDGLNSIEKKMSNYQAVKGHGVLDTSTNLIPKKNLNISTIGHNLNVPQLTKSPSALSSYSLENKPLEKTALLADSKNGKIIGNVELEKKEEQELESLNERAQKLLNAKDNNRRNVIMQFSLVTLIFVLYFITDYIVQILYLGTIRDCINHLQLISKRAPAIKYAHEFALEDLASSYITVIGGI